MSKKASFAPGAAPSAAPPPSDRFPAIVPATYHLTRPIQARVKKGSLIFKLALCNPLCNYVLRANFPT
eukprot:CCRYP_002443-RF/>CCRYP_002443-RF protein AED:0.49 eAED:0.49 QI:0/0/0/1/0/0/2/0/67